MKPIKIIQIVAIHCCALKSWKKVGFLIIDIQIYKKDKAKIVSLKMASKKQAEKLKSCEMKDEG